MKFKAIKRRIYARLGNPSNHDFFRGHKEPHNCPVVWMCDDEGRRVAHLRLKPPGTPLVKRRDRFYRKDPCVMQFSMGEFGMENLRAAMGINRA